MAAETALMMKEVIQMLQNVKMLTLEMAKKIAAAAEEEARKNKINIVISILDAGGNLKYFQRMEGTSYGSVRISQLKANTSASLPVSSRALAERSAKFLCNPYGEIPDTLLLPGGLPIITEDGQHIGAIGISGATSDQDEVCAQAGLNAVKKELAF